MLPHPCALAPQHPAAPEASEGERGGLEPVRILLVESNPAEALAVRELLARADYGIFEVDHVTGLGAVEAAIARKRPDAVLVDLGVSGNVPGEDDGTVLRRLRSRIGDQSIPIIALTGQESDIFALRTLHPEAEDVLVKGRIDQGALPRVIHNALERQTLMANLYRIIVHNPDGIVVVNDSGHVLFANPAASALFNRSIPELLDHQFGYPVAGGDTVEVNIGAERIAEMRVVEVDWLNEPAYLTSLRDVTERKRMEQLALEAKREADLANRAKSEFLAYMSHELRTPLNAIMGFSEMIKLEILGKVGVPSYRDYADAIHTSGRHLLGIINDILDLSAVEAGKIELSPEEFDISAAIAASLRLVKGLAREKGLKLVSWVEPDLPHLTADFRRFQQILLNLLSNAIKFTAPEGMVSVTCRCDDQGALTLTIADTGVGISIEDMANLMVPFGRPSHSAARRQHGSGLGLYISRLLVEMHGGSLALESVVGQGTTALVRFPARLLVRHRA